jgi:subtilisin-like proprotein convertase family protein
VPVVDDIVNSSTVAGETEGGGWRLEVEDAKENWVGGPNAQFG